MCVYHCWFFFFSVKTPGNSSNVRFKDFLYFYKNQKNPQPYHHPPHPHNTITPESQSS